MKRALLVLIGLVAGAWVGTAWGRAGSYSSPPRRPFGEHERLSSDAALRVLRQDGPGRVTHFRSA